MIWCKTAMSPYPADRFSMCSMTCPLPQINASDFLVLRDVVVAPLANDLAAVHNPRLAIKRLHEMQVMFDGKYRTLLTQAVDEMHKPLSISGG
ncbi:hypothetical protein F01_390003 [Burkholderia cenocepacia]|nr:hypothetical protein F01_390003 [Burkholderia cenocepacia]